MSAETTVNIAFAAFLVAAAAGLFWLYREPGPTESKQDRFIREACTPGLTVWDDRADRWITLPPGVQPGPHQYTDREVVALDQLELAWDAPAYVRPAPDPAWDAGRERLWDAARDEHTNTPEGD